MKKEIPLLFICSGLIFAQTIQQVSPLFLKPPPPKKETNTSTPIDPSTIGIYKDKKLDLSLKNKWNFSDLTKPKTDISANYYINENNEIIFHYKVQNDLEKLKDLDFKEFDLKKNDKNNISIQYQYKF